MALNQLQNLKAFVDRELADVVKWNGQVTVDKGPDGREISGDHAAVTIKTAWNLYKLRIWGSYQKPPLGEVHFHFPAAQLVAEADIQGPKNDESWGKISAAIHRREIGDQLAAARRGIAEAGDAEALKTAQAHLALVEVSARKWGIIERIAIPGEVPAGVTVLGVEGKSFAAGPDTVVVQHGDTPPADGRVAHLGQDVLFFTNPGEGVAGLTALPAKVTRVQSGGRVSLIVFPDNSETIHRDGVQRRGGLVQHNCWDFNADAERQASRIRHLEEAIEKMADEGNALMTQVSEMAVRLAALEAKPARKSRAAVETDTAPAKEPELTV